MSETLPKREYVIDPLAPFPARWRDHISSFRVMAGPVQGYVMVRRPRAVPFCLHVRQLLNADQHPIHGPFVCLTPQEPQG